MELKSLEVGKEFWLFKTNKMLGVYCCVLEVLSDGIFCVSVYLNNMSAKEKKALKNDIIRVKLFRDSDYFILPMFKYGNNLEFSLIFDPLKYIDERKDNMFKSNMVIVVGIESSNGVIETLRYCNMPKRLYLALMVQRDSASKVDGFSEKYNKWVNDLYRRYSDDELWDRGVYVGKMGE